MKKNTLTKLMSLTLALATTLTLTACGGGKDDPGAGSTGTGAPGGTQAVQETAEGTTLSQYLSGGESIWYLVNGSVSSVGKDTGVEYLFLLEPDGTAYCGEAGGLTLGELAQMEETEITSLVQEAHRKAALEGSIGAFGPSLDEILNAGRLSRGEILVGMLFGDYSMLEDLLAISTGGDAPVDELMNEYCVYLQTDTSGVPQELDAIFQTCIDQFASYCEYLQTHPFDMDYWNLAEALNCGGRDIIAESIYSEDPADLERTYQLYDEFMASLDAIEAYLESYEPAPGQYKLSLNTDRTGNAAESVTFACAIPQIAGSTEITSFTCYATSGEAQTVYDASYGGMSVEGGAFITRMEGSYSFVVEQPGDSGLPVDVEPADLFA